MFRRRAAYGLAVSVGLNFCHTGIERDISVISGKSRPHLSMRILLCLYVVCQRTVRVIRNCQSDQCNETSVASMHSKGIILVCSSPTKLIDRYCMWITDFLKNRIFLETFCSSLKSLSDEPSRSTNQYLCRFWGPQKRGLRAYYRFRP